MGVWDRAAEVGGGRWHVRLTHPANIVVFEDVTAGSVDDAITQALALHPGFTVEWAVREPNRYGVFSNGMSTR